MTGRMICLDMDVDCDYANSTIDSKSCFLIDNTSFVAMETIDIHFKETEY